MTGLPAEKPDAILFDWDGTLADSMAWIRHVHNAVRERMGEAAWTDEEFAYYSRWSSREIYPEIFGDRAAQAFQFLNEEIAKGSTMEMEPIPGAEILLTILDAAKIPMGVVSNKVHAPLCEDVRRFGWDVFFKTVVGAGRAARDKPSGTPAIFAADELSVRPSRRVWFVGDSETDALCSGDAGLYFIGLGHRMARPKEGEGVRFDTLADFTGAVRRASWQLS